MFTPATSVQEFLASVTLSTFTLPLLLSLLFGQMPPC